MRTTFVRDFLVLFVSALEFALPAAEPSERSNSTPWADVVRAWVVTGDYESASRWLKDYLKHSADPDVGYAYLYCLYQKGDYRHLLSRARTKRFAASVSEARGRILIGLARWRLNDVLAALQSWATVLAANPRDDCAWECVRIAILSAPRRDRSILVETLLRTLGNSPFASAFLSGILDSLRGESALAEKRLNEARALFPESRAVALALRDLYRHKGDFEDCCPLDEWLARSHGPEKGEIGQPVKPKSNTISDLRLHSLPLEAPSAPYSLPWPAGYALFCASHKGRRETPHSGRGSYALDFFLPQGMPVLAAREGVVCGMADRQEALGNREFGTFVLIAHGDGTFSRYYHLRGGSFRVRMGQHVRQGDVLAESGRSGRCQSRHLHFEVLRKAKLRLSGPRIYFQWETIPVDFGETRDLVPEETPDRWLVSHNRSPQAR